MKKSILFIILIAAFGGVQAQSDTIKTNQHVADSIAEYGIGYQKPNINPIYYFGSPFSIHFCEVKYYVGLKGIDIGATYAQIEEVWGWHGSAGLGKKSAWIMGGADYRLSKPWTAKDWQAFGSVGIHNQMDTKCIKPAFELGIRCAAGEDVGKFSMFSSSFSIIYDCQQLYATVGMSLIIGILGSSFALLGLNN